MEIARRIAISRESSSGGFGYALDACHCIRSKTRNRRSPTMRQERIIQATIFEVFATHEIGRELKAVSQWFDEHRALLGLASGDLRRHGLRETGRHGLPAEAVLRCALLKQYRQLSYEELAFHLEDSASFRALAIQYSRGKERKAKLYQDLIAATRATVTALQHAGQCLAACATLEAEVWRGQVRHYLPLIERIITQTERRVLGGEALPAGDKLVSLFEPHADIIVKSGRGVHYGHKINLATRRSGLIPDVVVEAGHPADAQRFLSILQRHIEPH